MNLLLLLNLLVPDHGHSWANEFQFNWGKAVCGLGQSASITWRWAITHFSHCGDELVGDFTEETLHLAKMAQYYLLPSEHYNQVINKDLINLPSCFMSLVGALRKWSGTEGRAPLWFRTHSFALPSALYTSLDLGALKVVNTIKSILN